MSNKAREARLDNLVAEGLEREQKKKELRREKKLRKKAMKKEQRIYEEGKNEGTKVASKKMPFSAPVSLQKSSNVMKPKEGKVGFISDQQNILGRISKNSSMYKDTQRKEINHFDGEDDKDNSDIKTHPRKNRNGVSGSRKSSLASNQKSDHPESGSKQSEFKVKFGKRKNSKNASSANELFRVEVSSDGSSSEDVVSKNKSLSNRGSSKAKEIIASKEHLQKDDYDSLLDNAKDKFQSSKYIQELNSLENLGSSSLVNHSARYMPVDRDKILITDKDRIQDRYTAYLGNDNESSKEAEAEEDGDHVGVNYLGTRHDDKCLQR